MVSPAVVGTGSTNKVSGTAQTKASVKKSGDFKSVMADSLANGATNGNIGKTNIKDNLINVQNTNTNKISAKNNTSEDKSSVTGSVKNADTSSISDVNSKILKMLLKKNSMYQMKTSKRLWSYLGLQHWIFFQLPK